MSNRYGIVDAVLVQRKTLALTEVLRENADFLTTDFIGCRFTQNTSGVLVLETPAERDARQTEKVSAPRGGDAVRLMAPWYGAESLVGSIGIINGFCDKDPEDGSVEITFNFSAFVGGSPEVASVSGGPGSIATPISELQLTDEIHTYSAWMWRDGRPSAGNAHRYMRKSRLWNWYPKQPKSN